MQACKQMSAILINKIYLGVQILTHLHKENIADMCILAFQNETYRSFQTRSYFFNFSRTDSTNYIVSHFAESTCVQ